MQVRGALALSLFALAHALQPNFLFILLDDADAELNATSAASMPALAARVVAAGLDLTAAHVTSPICCPSRTSLFSGRYPHNLGDDSLGWCGNFSASREDSLLVALGRAGYVVGQAGKWYNEEGEAQSFCEPGYVPAWKDGSARGRASDAFLLCQEGVYFGNPYNANGEIITRGHAPADYMTAVIGNRSLAFLRNATAGSAPWINFVAFQAPHLPATPAPWYADAPVAEPRAPRTPAWNVGWQDKHFIIDNGIDKPMSAGLINGSDTLHTQRLRALLSVDDYVREAVDLLEAAGALDNTFIIFTSDHGYHLGQWGLWCEKAMPYSHDTRVPLYIRGPGVPAGSASAALVAMNVDLGPTLLELAGAPDAWPSGTARRDGRSLAPLLRAPAAPPAGWRTRMLIEFVGWTTADEWLSPKQFDLTPSADAGLINGASNRWTALLVANETAHTLVADWRPPSLDGRAATNWTEAYDLAADPESLVNLAVRGRAPAARIAAMRDEMWAAAYCVGAECP